jgi:hypothetical protein
MLGEAAANGFTVGVFDETNAEPTVAEHLAQQRVAAPSSPTPAAEAAPPEPPEPASEQEPVGLPDFTPLPDDDLDALLAEAAIDDQIEAEITAETAEYDESYDPDEARQRKKDQKRIEWLEAQLVVKSRNGWVAENLRKYPLLATYFADEVGAIDATSRRGFARAAEQMNATYTKALAGPLADIEALRTGTAVEARAEARQEAARQWGAPTTDPAGSVAAEVAAANAAELDAARQRKAPLHERLAILAKTNKIL